jgi:hypothetical protein
LEPYANANSTGERYSKFFRETVHSPLEICGIICDNLLVQIAGLHAFLAHRAEDVPRIMQIPCLNHMTNLAFTYPIRTDPFAYVVRQLQVIHALNSPPGIEILGGKCPAIIRTRWGYLIEVISFILDYRDHAQIALWVVGDLMIPKEFAQVCLLLFPVSLFSSAVE